MKRISTLCFFAITFAVASCAKIHTGEELSLKDFKYIKQLGLLDPDERIYQFYSNNGIEGAGNFYTTKRIAHYWNHQRDKQNEFAYYKDIAHLSTHYHPNGDFVIPFMTVTKKDSTQFKVYVDGDDAEVKSFFDNCQTHWQAGK